VRVLTHSCPGCCILELLRLLLLVVVEAVVGGLALATASVFLQVAFKALKEVAEDDGVEDGLDGGDKEEEDANRVGKGMVLIETVCVR